MSIARVAIIYDDIVRPDTTGVYCHRALRRLASVQHFRPDDIDDIPDHGFDLYLNIDDGLRYRLPARLRPCAWWVIDTHLDPAWYFHKARDFDLLFAAQRDGARRLAGTGPDGPVWLPLACDPELHRPCRVPRQFNVSFVGNLNTSLRVQLLDLIRQNFEKVFVGQCYGLDMARIYSASHLVFNRSVANDLNMRVFETLACGAMLITNDLSENGQNELFQNDVHLATYGSPDELLDRIRFSLAHPDAAQRIAGAGRQAVLAAHTYEHRMRTILAAASPLSRRVLVPVPLLAESGHEASAVAEPDTDLQPFETDDANPEPPRPDPLPDAALTSIVIVTHNQIRYTRQCLRSIRRCTSVPYELICVDNASTDGTADFLAAAPDVRLIRNSENRGFPAAANLGIAEAKGEQILLMNNDVLAATGWLERMLRPMQSDPAIGLVGPCSNRVSGEQAIPVSYADLPGLESFAAERARTHDGVVQETDRLVGFCLLIRKAVVDRIGALDERFGLGMYEDDDFCRRAIAAGFRAVIARDAFVHHFGSRTFRGNGIDAAALLRHNQALFEEKWSQQPQVPAPDPDAPAAQSSSASGAPGVNLSLCMIVRDSARTLGDCLRSIRPWVDEMVVVDTGSTDQTVQIAQEHGARVLHFPWCDDFAAARNESIRHATGRWIFWMDSDDTIDEQNGRALRELLARPHPASLMGFVMQVHCPGAGGDAAADVTAVDHIKVFRNLPDLRFEGRIHEQVLPSIRRRGGEVGWTDLFVVHSGYDHSPEGQRAKRQRDLRLLELDLKDRPDHPFVLFNLGMTWCDMQEHAKAAEALERCLERSSPGESHVKKAFALLLISYNRLGLHERAWTTCRRGVSLFPDDPELRFHQGALAWQFGRLDLAERAYRMVLRGAAERSFSSIDRGIAGYKTRHNLALIYAATDRLEEAELQWRSVTEEMPSFAAGWHGLVETLLQQNKLEAAEAAVAQLQAVPALGADASILAAELHEKRGDLQAARQCLAGAAAQHPDDLSILRARCRLLFERGDIEEAEASLQELVRRAPDDGAALHNLGTIYFRAGCRDDAVRCYRQSLQVRPDSPATQAILDSLTAKKQSEAAAATATVAAG